MASASLSIRKNTSGSANIILNINYGRKKKYRHSTGYSVENHKNWDSRNKEIKIVKEEPKAVDINTKLSELKGVAQELIRDYNFSDAYITNDIIKRDFTEALLNKGKSKNKKPTGFIAYFNWFIDHYSKHPRPSTNKPYKKDTLRSIRNSKTAIEKFQKQYGFLQFKDITLDFHTVFLDYLTEIEYSMNYVGTIIKNLKVVMNDAYERDLHTNLDFKKQAFTKPSEDVENIYLNQDQIKAISNVDLIKIIENKDNTYFGKKEKKPTLDYLSRCRDFFILECHTGLRVADTIKLTKKNIITIDIKNKPTEVISLQMNKTERPIYIPKKKIKNILESYGNDFPKKVVDSKINKYIKIIAKAAGLEEEVEIKRTIKGKETIETYKMYEKVSNHTGRRSFCTNAYRAGVPVIDIMTISGHKSEKTFLKYIKASTKERFERIVDHPFFQ
jgi:integrase